MADIRRNRKDKADLLVACFVCSTAEPLPTAEDHHRTPKAFGGDDSQENRVWLCPSCHARLHRVQEFLMRGQTASGFSLCNSIFPTNGTARGLLWTLANEAAEAERLSKDLFDMHNETQKVSITVDKDVWAILKAEAKAQKTSAGKLAGRILKKATQEM